MTLGELIQHLELMRDTVFGVDTNTDITFTVGSYTTKVEDVKVLIEARKTVYDVVELVATVVLVGADHGQP